MSSLDEADENGAAWDAEDVRDLDQDEDELDAASGDEWNEGDEGSEADDWNDDDAQLAEEFGDE